MKTIPSEEDVDAVVDVLRDSRSILFITGAGLSADSGLPTYRGVGGLYNGVDAEAGMPIEALLSAKAFELHPALTWKHLMQINEACRGAKPNRGHEVIAAMESRFERVWVLTQNVDGFHRAAGSRNVIDIHGDLHQIHCTWCDYERSAADYSELGVLPKCPECDSVLRPRVVLFGERLPAKELAAYQQEMSRGFDVVFSIGTSSLFPFISAPVLDACRKGVPAVEINPGETDVSEFVSIRIRAGAAASLEAIWEKLSSN